MFLVLGPSCGGGFRAGCIGGGGGGSRVRVLKGSNPLEGENRKEKLTESVLMQ